jgi:hypothetical protein
MDELKKYAELCDAQKRSIECYAKQINSLKDAIETAVLAEREACASLCEPQENHDDPLTAWNIAQLIRARGDK